MKINPKDRRQKRKRMLVHLVFSVIMCLVVILFRELNNSSVVNAVLKAVGYTYGPILGLFAFGLFTKYTVKMKYLPWICLLSPVVSYMVDYYSVRLFWGYCFGFEILLFNGFLCFMGLLWIRVRK